VNEREQELRRVEREPRKKKHIRLEKPRQELPEENPDEVKRRRRRSGVIRLRLLRNTVLATLAIVIVAFGAFSLAMYNYYTSTILASLESRAQTAAGVFQNYTQSNYLGYARQFISQFEGKNKMEVQFLTSAGRVLTTSLMDISGGKPGTEDVTRAIETKKLASWEGEDPSTGDHIMSASAPVVYNGTVVGVVRLVTSLRLFLVFFTNSLSLSNAVAHSSSYPTGT